MKKYSIILGILILAVLCFGCSKTEIATKTEIETKQENISVNKTGYDIEKVFSDPLFAQIMEGKTIPTEFRHGFGGEGGYIQYPSTDPEVIKKYIEALKEFSIKEIITDKEDFVYVADAVNDYIFYLDDGRELLISIDLNAYVTDRENGIQYVFEYNKRLNDLNREYDTKDEQESLKEYDFSSENDIYDLSDDDVIYLATHSYKTSDFIDDFKGDPYDDFGIPLGEFERFEPVLLNPGGERKDYDVNRKLSDQEYKKLTEEYIKSFKEDFDVVYLGETEHYVEYRYSSSGELGTGRRCFYRNMFMMEDKIDGNSYAGSHYLGELTVENVLSEEDFYFSIFDDFYLLWRGVEDRNDAIVYTCYHTDIKQTGDYSERGQNQKAQILKTEIFFDKETHSITGDSEIIRSVDIPGTTMIYDEPQ